MNDGADRVAPNEPLAVKALVSRFLKDTEGNTLYQVDVHLPHTKQVWSVFKRYKDCISLRQQLEAACKHHMQQQHQALWHGPRSPTTSRASPAKRALGGGAAASSSSAQASGAASKAAPGTPGGRDRSAAAVAADAIQKILADHRFPSKLALTGSVAQKQERKRALNGFFMALAQVRPLPQVVAIFLGLLEGNRLLLDRNGDYVQIAPTDDIVPLPPSPGLRTQERKSLSRTRNILGVSLVADTLEVEPMIGDMDISSPVTRGVSPTSTAKTARGDLQRRSGSGRLDRRSRRDPPSVLPGARERRRGLGPRDCDEASQANDRVVAVDQGFMSETDEPSGDSEDEPSRRHRAGDGDRGHLLRDRFTEGSGGAARAGNAGLNPDRIAHGGLRAKGGSLSPRGRSLPRREPNSRDVTRMDPPTGQAREEGSRGRAELVTEVGSLARFADVARLRGGGGGHDPSDYIEDADEGLSIVWSDEGRGSAGVMTSAGGGKGRTGEDMMVGAKESRAAHGGTRREEELDRLLQKDFVDGFLDQVVVKVVGRRNLDDNLPPQEAEAGSPLSSEERDLRLAELMSLGIELPREKLVALLSYHDWGPLPAAAMYQNLIAAGKGSLERVTPGAALRGMENGGNTCYIDSLVFAMYATVDAFDWLLLKTLPSGDSRQVKLLQKHLRFLVNQVRTGAAVPREHSNLIREQLRACGWGGGSSTQEDVSELFTFLVILLRCPALPLSEALFHGGQSESGDSRISTERALFLALPEEDERERSPPPKGRPSTPVARRTFSPQPRTPGSQQARGREGGGGGGIGGGWKVTSIGSAGEGAIGGGGAAGSREKDASGSLKPVTLEQVLMHNFHDNRVEGLRRTVSGQKGVESQPVDAWRMVSMLPFYALSGEHAADSDPSNDLHFDTVMLPMVLKRYETSEPHSASRGPGQARKSKREVVVPLRLDCSKFMTPADGGKGQPTADYGRFVLLLRSAVCHLGGETVNKGHYVAYAADRYRNGSKTKKGGEITGRMGAKRGYGSKADGNTEKRGSTFLEAHGDSYETVSWLRLDDLKKDPAGAGFVERVEGIHDADWVFREDLGLHSYVLFYELVALNLDKVGKAQIDEAYSLIMTQPDYEYALHLDMTEKRRATAGGAVKSETCIVS